MKKRVTHKLALGILTVLLLFSMTACGNKENAEADISDAVKEEESVSEAAEETEEKTEEAEATEEPTPEPIEEKITAYPITAAYAFSEDRAYVVYKDEDAGKKCLGLIDTDGNVLYSTEDYEPLYDVAYNVYRTGELAVKDGFSYFQTSDGWVIVDSDGNETYRVQNTDSESYEIIGQTGGRFLFSKKTSGISENKTELYISDSTGKALTDTLISWNADEHVNVSENITKLGNSFFYDDYDDCWIINIPEGKVTSLEKINGGRIYDTVKGTIVLWGRSLRGVMGIPVENYPEISASIDELIKLFLNVDDLHLSVDKFKQYSDDIVVMDGYYSGDYYFTYKDYSNRYGIEVADVDGNMLFDVDLSSLNLKDMKWIGNDDEYLALLLTGQDNKKYAAMVGRNGELLFEPVLADITHANYQNGYLLYYASHEGWLLDSKGTVYKVGEDDLSAVDNTLNMMDPELSEQTGSNINYFVFSGGFINLRYRKDQKGEGYMSLDGSKVITEVLVKEQ